MVDKKQIQKKKYEYSQRYIGNDMIELIDIVSKKFEKEYGVKPTIVDISNLIARRVVEHDLF